MVVAVAAATLISCQKEPIEPQITLPDEGGFSITASATLGGDGTKTHFGTPDTDENTYPVLWDGSDKILLNILPKAEGVVMADGVQSKQSTQITLADDSSRATFYFPEFDAIADGADAIDYVAIHGGTDQQIDCAEALHKVTLPASQKPGPASYDPSAALMGSVVFDQVEEQSHLDLNFSHLSAYARMRVTDLTLNAEQVTTVTITSSDHSIAGVAKWSYRSQSEGSTLVADESGGVSSIALDASGLTIAADSPVDLYFAAIPTLFSAGDRLTFVVETTKRFYTREIVLTEAQAEAFVFQQGKIMEFEISFAEAAKQVKSNLYEQISSSPLNEDDQVILVTPNRTLAAGAMRDVELSCVNVTVQNNLIDLNKHSGVQIFTLGKSPDGEYWTLYGNMMNAYLASDNSNKIIKPTTDVNVQYAHWTIEGGDIECRVNGELLRYFYEPLPVTPSAPVTLRDKIVSFNPNVDNGLRMYDQGSVIIFRLITE